MHYSYIL